MPDMPRRGLTAAGILPAFRRDGKLRSDCSTTMAIRPHLVVGSACPPPARFGDAEGSGRLARTTSDPFSKQTTDQSGDQPSGRHPGWNGLKPVLGDVLGHSLSSVLNLVNGCSRWRISSLEVMHGRQNIQFLKKSFETLAWIANKGLYEV